MNFEKPYGAVTLLTRIRGPPPISNKFLFRNRRGK